MKRLMLFLCGSAALACAADLGTARTVYILSMSRGLDQYLANRLTNEHVFQVVTDPKLADVIFTEQIGEGFQAKLETISPTPKPEKPAEPEKPAKAAAPDKDAKDAKDSKADAGEPAGPKNPFLTEPENSVAPVGTMSSFARNKGVIFLVDAKSRQVLWSTYEPARSSASKELNRTAAGIVSRLKKDLKQK
ncbi:MAG TPA: hypothetical protein VKF41_02800 [Bryobacteraceae bacterium]|nr:hypothetical protein [Bryobacteraceae bacterium]